MIDLKTLMKSALVGAVMAMVPLTASASTVTVLDASNIDVTGGGPFSITALADFTVNVSVGASEIFSETVSFVNDTIYDFIVSTSGVNFPPDFAVLSATAEVSSPLANIVLALSGVTTFAVTAGSSFDLVIAGTSLTPGTVSLSLSPIPLPAAGFLLIGALGGLGALSRRRRKAA